MTTNRPLESAELKFAQLTREISNNGYVFREVSPEVYRTIRRTYGEVVGDLCTKVDATDEGDRELLRAYGKYLAEVAKVLQSL